MRSLLSCRVCSSQLVELNEVQQLEIEYLVLTRFRGHISASSANLLEFQPAHLVYKRHPKAGIYNF